MRPYILAKTNWKNLKDGNIELGFLLWVETEAHNYYLPYATDKINKFGKIMIELCNLEKNGICE